MEDRRWNLTDREREGRLRETIERLANEKEDLLRVQTEALRTIAFLEQSLKDQEAAYERLDCLEIQTAQERDEARQWAIRFRDQLEYRPEYWHVHVDRFKADWDAYHAVIDTRQWPDWLKAEFDGSLLDEMVEEAKERVEDGTLEPMAEDEIWNRWLKTRYGKRERHCGEL